MISPSSSSCCACDFPEYREAAIRYKADYFFLKDEIDKIINLVKSILSKKGLRADGLNGEVDNM